MKWGRIKMFNSCKKALIWPIKSQTVRQFPNNKLSKIDYVGYGRHDMLEISHWQGVTRGFRGLLLFSNFYVKRDLNGSSPNKLVTEAINACFPRSSLIKQQWDTASPFFFLKWFSLFIVKITSYRCSWNTQPLVRATLRWCQMSRSVWSTITLLETVIF